MIANKATEERNGWRDESISKRHRKWGPTLAATDIDFVLVEYASGTPQAIVEYKGELARADKSNVQKPLKALRNLAKRAAIPFFICRYANDLSWFKVTPVDRLAEKWVPEATIMSEMEWVTLLYRIKGRDLPDGLFDEYGRLIDA